MSIFFIFLIGLFFGSFLNVLADRLPNGKSMLGRSSCDFCKHVLGTKDLIPLFSFIYLRGKCRYCAKKLSFNYPLLELVTGFGFVLSFILVNFQYYLSLFGLNYLTKFESLHLLMSVSLQPSILALYLFAFIITSVLIVIFFADFRYGIIPDTMIAVGVLATVVWLLFLGRDDFINHFIAGAGAFLFFYLLFVLTRQKGIGFGDVKFAFFMGLLLGVTDVIFALYIAFLTGGIVGIILILWKKKQMKSAISFGPFLVLGTFISFFLSSLFIPVIWGFL